jgi:hypothetical protein
MFSTSKDKTIPFKGRESISSIIVINNTATEKLNTYNYMGCSHSHEKEKYIPNKIKVHTDHRKHSSRSRTSQRPEANKIMNMQHSRNTYSTL